MIAVFAAAVARAQNDQEQDEVQQQQGQEQQGEEQEEHSKQAQQQQNQDLRQQRSQSSIPKNRGARAYARARSPTRPYQVVLKQVLDIFAADAGMGPIRRLPRYAIRRMSLNQTIPKLETRYIQIAFIEKLMQAAKGQLVVCPPCSQQTTALVEGKLLIMSPSSNAAQVDQAANELGITHFIDAVFVLDRTHIALAVQVLEAKSKTLIWSKTYDSELLAQGRDRRADLEVAIAASRGRDKYRPVLGLTAAIGGAGIPNVGGTVEDSQMLAAHVRLTESFARKSSRFGLALSYYKATTSTLKEYPSDKPTNETPATSTKEKVVKPIAKPFTRATAAHATYASLFLGNADNRDQPRLYADLGLGALTAVGYLAPAIRLAVEAHLGRMFVTSIGVHYFAPTNVRIDQESQRAAGGIGGEFLLGISL